MLDLRIDEIDFINRRRIGRFSGYDQTTGRSYTYICGLVLIDDPIRIGLRFRAGDLGQLMKRFVGGRAGGVVLVDEPIDHSPLSARTLECQGWIEDPGAVIRLRTVEVTSCGLGFDDRRRSSFTPRRRQSISATERRPL